MQRRQPRGRQPRGRQPRGRQPRHCRPGRGEPRRREPGGRRPGRALVLLLPVLAVAGAVAGCSQPAAAGHSTAPAYVASCGTAKTAADVPVQVKIVRGHATCGTAKAVEAAYATAIRSGQAPGNGGGGPVKVQGWTCQGFATP